MHIWGHGIDRDHLDDVPVSKIKQTWDWKYGCFDGAHILCMYKDG